ncbi:hypothetical protein CRG98_004813 [Punica granatum]|uniref:Uncharacterized protein n=1 Tax=Punica granatum TaxID=22663 RepID=A0A2I0L280_PUNGR|nr:hypothetical protein CRG98_004813 [Punica granatum]
MRQFGSLQTVPEDTARTRFEHTWWENQTSIDCQSDIQQVLSTWRTAVMELPYFLEHPTQDERDFQATKYTPYGAPSTSSKVVQAELTSLRSERNRLRREVAEKDEQLIDRRQLQRELAQVRTKLQRRDQELARANVALERSRKRARGGPHPS